MVCYDKLSDLIYYSMDHFALGQKCPHQRPVVGIKWGREYMNVNGPGEGALPYMGCICMCGPKGWGTLWGITVSRKNAQN